MTDILNQRTGAAIKAARGAIPLRDLSHRLATMGHGISPAALSRIENGKRPPTVRELLVIAATLDVSPDALVFPGADDEPVPLTDRIVESVGTLRAWFTGRAPLMGTLRRAPRPSWPIPDDVTSSDRLYERRDRWERSRPARERRARVRDEEATRRLLRGVEDYLDAAGSDERTTAQSRSGMVAALEQVISAALRLQNADDLPGTKRDPEAGKAKGALAYNTAHEQQGVLKDMGATWVRTDKES